MRLRSELRIALELAPGGLVPPDEDEVEREANLKTLEMVGGSTSRAADALDVAHRLGVPEGQLQPERHRLGMDTVRTAYA